MRSNRVSTPLISRLIAISLCCLLTGCSWFGGKSSGDGISDADLEAAQEARFGDGSIPSAEGGGLFADIPFAFDSNALSYEARELVQKAVALLNTRSDLRVQLEGHCDERGTQDYNLALGAARARAVKEALLSAGISASRIDAISYGEDVPLDPGHDESAYAKNRRVHIAPLGDGN